MTVAVMLASHTMRMSPNRPRFPMRAKCQCDSTRHLHRLSRYGNVRQIRFAGQGPLEPCKVAFSRKLPPFLGPAKELIPAIGMSPPVFFLFFPDLPQPGRDVPACWETL